MNRRLKVLVSAYACNPYRGSEEGVGWGWVNAIAKYHDLWVITGELHRQDIEKEVECNPERYRNVRFLYVPRTRWLNLEKVCPLAYLWTYRLWQRAAFRLGVRLHEDISFDLFHLITYVGFRVPGHLWKQDIPFVWGPIGGLENTPWRLLPMLGLKGCTYYAGRNLLNSYHKRFQILPKRAFQKANGGIIAATQGIQREILHWYGQESEVICEVGPPPVVTRNHSVRKTGQPLRIVWSGLHLPGKALPLLLRATASLTAELDWSLDVLGQGPRTDKWQRLARKIGVDAKCRWHGQLPRTEAVKLLDQAHVFVITSVKDLTSTVLLESLSQGVPVICPDHCGFADVVTDKCGIRVPLTNPNQLVKDFAAAIKSLVNDESKRRMLAAGALERIGEFSWEKKAQAVDCIYKRVCS